MKILVTTADEEITLFEDDGEFEPTEALKNISVNRFEDILAISNTSCECLLDRIIKRADGKWPKTPKDQMQRLETFNFADVEKIEILLR